MKHPKGLMILFFTEMWERFSYYGMKAILVLFLVSETNGGFGWSNDQALALLGIYTMMVYVMGIPGGILADRVLGQKRAVMIGGALLCAGHGLMAIPAVWSFYTALVLIVLGVGLLKPNISTMVGGLYPDGDSRREAGFTIFYMGINLGSLFATIVVALVADRIGWHFGFSLAGIGMFLGQVVFMLGGKHLAEVGNLTPKVQQQAEPKKPFTREEKDRMLVICISLVVVLVFFMAFEQAAGLLTLYTNTYTDRVVLGFEVPAAMFQGLNAAFILLLGTTVAGYWRRKQQKRGVSALFKMGVGTTILGLGYLFMVGASLQRASSETGQSAIFWLVGTYLLHTIGELCLSPVALSFITRVSPKRVVATMMGLFWAMTGFANYLAAQVGRLAGDLGELAIFGGLVVIAVVSGLLLAIFSKRINRLTHGLDGEPADVSEHPEQGPLDLSPAEAIS